ncbi:GNAT family N-acetyltransferase [Patulibacter sp. NPDC049589]|uniref:GNAT family N-acetyltransferase n=1 Tax=Patulibacter sp. NPDC049589 TaxID=3154731 RepID=UPI0034248F41
MEPDPDAASGAARRPGAFPGIAPAQLRTERLLLRGWRPADREPFAAMNADPDVMRWIASGVLDPVTSDALRARLRREWLRSGRGVWAVERGEDGAFLGFCGLTAPAWGGPRSATGDVEVGWRLARDAWGYGYASEAAAAALRVAWDDLGLQSAVALVHPDNERSLGVGERLGMRVVGTTRHRASGWEVLVLRATRPAGPQAPASDGARPSQGAPDLRPGTVARADDAAATAPADRSGKMSA